MAEANGEEQLIHLTNHVQELTNRLALLTARVEHPVLVERPPTPARPPKLPFPENFDGNISRYRDFLSAVQNVFGMNPAVYSTDEIKCRFIGSLCTKDALSWFRQLITVDSPLLTHFDAFLDEFDANFNDPHAQRHAQDAIKRLRQGSSSAVNYAARFRRLAADTEFNDSALVEQFRMGLNDEVKDTLALTLP